MAAGSFQSQLAMVGSQRSQVAPGEIQPLHRPQTPPQTHGGIASRSTSPVQLQSPPRVFNSDNSRHAGSPTASTHPYQIHGRLIYPGHAPSPIQPPANIRDAGMHRTREIDFVPDGQSSSGRLTLANEVENQDEVNALRSCCPTACHFWPIVRHVGLGLAEVSALGGGAALFYVAHQIDTSKDKSTAIPAAAQPNAYGPPGANGGFHGTETGPSPTESRKIETYVGGAILVVTGTSLGLMHLKYRKLISGRSTTRHADLELQAMGGAHAV